MNRSALAFIGVGVLAFALMGIWVGYAEYQRRVEEKRVMDVLTGPAKGFEPILDK